MDVFKTLLLDTPATLANVSGVLPIVNGGTNATTAANARTNLGLGTAAVVNLGTGVATYLATPTIANLLSATSQVARTDTDQTFSGTNTFNSGTASVPLVVNSTNAAGVGLNYHNSGTVFAYSGSAKYAISASYQLGSWGVTTSGAFNLYLGTNNTARLTLDGTTGAATLASTLAFSGTSSITSASGSALVLATGTSGTALSIASATNVPTFTAAPVAPDFVATNNGLYFGSSTASTTNIKNPSTGTISFNQGVSGTFSFNSTAGTGDTNILVSRAAGTASSWNMYLPTGSTDLRFFSGADRMTLSAAGALTLTGSLTGTSASFTGLLNITSGTTDGASISTYGLQIRTDTATKAGHISASQSGVANYPLFLGNDGYGTSAVIISASGRLGIRSGYTPTQIDAAGTLVVRDAVTGIITGYGVSGHFSDSTNATVSIVTGATGKGGIFSDSNFVAGASNAVGLTLANTTQNATFSSTTDASALGTASVVLSGGLSVAKKSYYGDAIIASGGGNGIQLSGSGTQTNILVNATSTGAAWFNAVAGGSQEVRLVANGSATTVAGFAASQTGLHLSSTSGYISVLDSGTPNLIMGKSSSAASGATFTEWGRLNATGFTSSASVSDSIGTMRQIPQNSKSAAYTTVLLDAGKHILHPSADTTARTFTIDSNANVAYAIGTAITFVNQASAGVMTISITTDTMRLAGAGTTGSRTLAANGIATALKVTSTEWIISGTGLT
jgi:hypothetical protein